MKKPLIPFGWLPGSWGLKGKTRDVAKAEYELSGYDLEKKLIEIKHADQPEKIARQILDIDATYGKLNDYEYKVKVAHAESTDVELAQRLNEIEYHFGNINKATYEKQKATLANEPYITVINTEFDPALKASGVSFEFDWNPKWIELLLKSGYTGVNEESIVQQWFEDVCQSVTLEKTENEPRPFNSRRPVTSVKRDDGTEYY